MHDKNGKAWCLGLKMQNRIKKTIKMILLISICVLGLTAFIIYSILSNYIKKINIIDDSSLTNTQISEIPALADDKDVLNHGATDITKKQGTDKPSEQKQKDEVYEVYQGIADQLNMQELESEEEDNENTPGRDQYTALPFDTQVFNNISLSNAAEMNLNHQNKADGGTTQDKGTVVDSQEDKNVSTDAIEPEDEDSIMPIIDDKVMNLLLIGQDAQCSDNTSPESFAIFTVNKRAKKLVTTTLANNLYLNIPDIGKERLVTAYRRGGAALLKKTLEKNFGIIIDGYIMADFSAYIDIVNCIGGVEIVIAKEELDPVNRNIRKINTQLGHNPEADIISEKGLVVLNGKQALGYSRNWYTPKGDLISYGNQKAVILSILNKVKSFSLIEMNGFLNEVLPKITTNLSEGRILEFIVMLPVYFNYGIENLSLPIKGTEKKFRVDGKTVLDYNVKKNLAQLYNHLYASQED